MTIVQTPGEVLARDFAAIAREVAMDLFPLSDILAVHQMSQEEWEVLSVHPTFVRTLASIQAEWNSAESTPARIKAKSQTAIEAAIEVYARAIFDPDIPLVQRVEAGKFLARLGELGERGMGDGGEKFHITFNIGEVSRDVEVKVPRTIDGELA